MKKEFVTRFTDPTRFRPVPMLTAAIGVTVLFFAVIAVNVRLAHDQLQQATQTAGRLRQLVEDVSDLHEERLGTLSRALLRGDHSAEADYRRTMQQLDRVLMSIHKTPDFKPISSALPAIYRAHSRLKAAELAVFRFVAAGQSDLALAAFLSPQYGQTDCHFHRAIRHAAQDLSSFRSALVKRFSQHLLVIALVSGCFMAVLAAVWTGIALMMRRSYRRQSQAEAALRESETKYRALIDALPLGAVILQDGIVIFANPAAAAMFGVASADDLVGLPWLSAVSEEEREQVRNISEARARGETEVPSRYTVTVKRRDGETFPAEVYVRPLQYNGSFAVQAVAVDLTERRRAEETLRTQVQILDEISDAVITTDLDARITSWNRGAERLYGYGADEVMGRHIGMLYVDPANLENEVVGPLLEKGTHSVEVRVKRKSGEEFEVQLSLTFLHDAQGGRQGMIGYSLDITERKRAERALRESEQRYRLLAESVSDVIWTIGLDLRFTYISPSRTGLAGYAPEELLGRSVTEIVEPSSISLVEQFGRELAQSLSSGSEPPASRMMEAENRHKNGSTVPVEVTIAPDFDADGRLRGFAGATRDVTERKAAERALAESEQRYRLLAQSASDLIWATDLDLCFTYVSPSAKGVMGYAPEELLGRSAFGIIAPSSFPLAEQLGRELAQSLSSGSKPLTPRMMEIEALHKNGSTFWAEITLAPYSDVDGRLLGLTGATRDITERKRNETIQSVLLRIAEAASVTQDIETLLEETRRELDRLINTKNFFVALYDESRDTYEFPIFRDEHDSAPRGRIRAPRSLTDFVRRTGVPILADAARLEELRSAGEIEPRGTPARQWMGVPLNTNRGVIGVMAAQGYTDDVVYTPSDLDVLTLVSGNLAVIIEHKRAVDALIESEERFRQAQKMEAVGRLAGGIAHDFNNLLTSILGHNDIVLHRLRKSDPLRESIEEVAKAAERAAGLTRQLLAFSRKQVLEPRVLDLNAIVIDIEKMLRRVIGEDIELLTRLQPDLGTTKADPGQIEQVLMNLVVNARDAMPAGGRLIVETANVESDEIQDRYSGDLAPGRYVMLAVSDNGTGMDAETQSHIFEPFFTTKEHGKGTGLGLSTVYGIVKQSAGHIAVFSELGSGSVFKVYLPRVEEAVETTEPPVHAEPKQGRETVLVVEDESGVRELVRQILEENGYTVLAAGLPSEALQLAELHGGKIDLLVTDIVMPQLRGDELARRLTARYPETKVLFISGYVDSLLKGKGVPGPGTSILEKPFTPETLARRVRQLLDAPMTVS